MDNDTIVIMESPVQGEDTTVNAWVQCNVCTLSFEDKEIINTGMELTDRHIHNFQLLEASALPYYKPRATITSH